MTIFSILNSFPEFTRAKVSAARVSELNPYVKIEFSDVDLNGDISFLKEYSVSPNKKDSAASRSCD